jgi:transcriptional regulator with XRE-family HTH domain
LREERGLSQEQLGYKAGLHRNYIGGVERGELNASLASIWKLARGLEMWPSELLALSEQLFERPPTRTR